MSKQHASKRRSMIGASLVLGAVAAFSFAPIAFAAGGPGGQNGGERGGGTGGGETGGSGTGGGGFSGGGFSGGYAGGGHSGYSGGTGGAPFARPSVGIGGHSGSGSPSFTPGSGSHFSPGITGSSSGGPHPLPGSPHNPGWQNGWNNGNYYGNHWNPFGYGNVYAYPYYYAFVPFLYGGYGYGYPYYDYGNPYGFYAIYDDGDAALPPINLPQQFGNPGPPIAAGAPPANAALPNVAAGPNAAAPNAAGAAAVADADDSDDSAGAEFFAQAESAFQQGRYKDALKLTQHAAIESPHNPKAHELMSLCMFALADYHDAAIEAHYAILSGPIADWATVFAYYGDQAKYTTQLRALEKYSHEKPKSAEARFLRAYHYLMTGHTDAAKEQLAEAVSLTPKDKLAADLLKKYGGNAAAAPAPAPPAAAPQAPANPPAKPANADPDSFDT